MKRIIISILWFLLNKLDKTEVGKINLSGKGISVDFSKGFLRVGKWEHIAITVSSWIKYTGEKEIEKIDDVALFRNGKLKSSEIIKKIYKGK